MNRKGFTLTELLAIIILLGLIAFIAIPVVNNMIEDSKKEAAKVSTLSYVKAINDQNDLYKLDSNKYVKIQSGNIKDINVYVKGETPTEGNVTISSTGEVTNLEICIHGYNVIYENNEVEVGSKCESSTIAFNGTYVAPTSNDTHKGIVYLDPTDLSKKCNASNSLSSGKIGCLKFYVFNDEDETVYKMILDHSTTPRIQWISEEDYVKAGGTASEYGTNGNTSKGPITIMSQLEKDTTGWNGNPRLISANEVAHLIGVDTILQWDSSKPNGTSIGTQVSWFYFDGSGTTYSNTNGWQKQTATGTNKSKYAWLYDYTLCSGYGCNNSESGEEYEQHGYWTSDAASGGTNVWRIGRAGALSSYNSSNPAFGLRPVIEIPKSYFE